MASAPSFDFSGEGMDNCTLALLTDPRYHLCKVTTISPAGLELKYLAGQTPLADHGELLLFDIDGREDRVDHLPYHVVLDEDDVDGTFTRGFSMRRCKLDFDELTTDAVDQIQNFIAQHQYA